MQVAVVGFGSMGLGIASSLLRSRFDITGFDSNSNKEKEFVSKGGSTDFLTEMVSNFDVIVIVVPNALQTDMILFGDSGIVSEMKSKSLIMVCTMVSPNLDSTMRQKC